MAQTQIPSITEITEALSNNYLQINNNFLLPVCPCRGECGRGRVGDVLEVTIKLFLLLVRQLEQIHRVRKNIVVFELKYENTILWNFYVA